MNYSVKTYKVLIERSVLNIQKNLIINTIVNS
jgi:hypothetical protein